MFLTTQFMVKKKKKALSYMSVHKLDFDPKCNRHFSHSV